MDRSCDHFWIGTVFGAVLAVVGLLVVGLLLVRRLGADYPSHAAEGA